MNNRNRKNWTTTDRIKLMRMYRSRRLAVRQIANRLGRTYYATIKQAGRMGLAWEYNPAKMAVDAIRSIQKRREKE